MNGYDQKGAIQINPEAWQAMNSVSNEGRLNTDETRIAISPDAQHRRTITDNDIKSGGLTQPKKVLNNDETGQRILIYHLDYLHQISERDTEEVIRRIEQEGSIHGERRIVKHGSMRTLFGAYVLTLIFHTVILTNEANISRIRQSIRGRE